MGDITVTPAGGADIAELVAAMGQREYFVDRLARQDRGEGVVLAARLGDAIVGHVYVWLAPADEAVVREHLPGVALLNHIEVRPDRRNQGIGTVIVGSAESFARELGHEMLALGVGVDNVGARRLYERLGYREWGHGLVDTTYTAFELDGTRQEFPESIRMMVKRL